MNSSFGLHIGCQKVLMHSNLHGKMIGLNKMVLEPNVSPHKQIIKDDDVKECISIEEVEH